MSDDDHDHDGRVARLGICSVCTRASVEGKRTVPEAPAFQDDLFLTTSSQVGRVYEAMTDGGWHTLRQVAGALGIAETSVSARFRDLRKAEFGGHVVEMRARPGRGGENEYRLVR